MGDYEHVLGTGMPVFRDDLQVQGTHEPQRVSVKVFRAGEGLGIVATDAPRYEVRGRPRSPWGHQRFSAAASAASA